MPFFATTYRYAEGSTDARDTVRPEHRAYLAELTDQGRLLLSGPYEGDPAGALLVFDAATEADARTLVAGDPFVEQELVAEVTVREWTLVSGRLAGHA